MKNLSITFVAFICLIVACVPDRIAREECDIEKFPFSHFQQIAAEFGEFREAIDLGDSEIGALFMGAKTNLVKFNDDLEILWEASYDFEFTHSDLLFDENRAFTILGATQEATILLKIDSGGTVKSQSTVHAKPSGIQQIISDEHGGIIAVGSKINDNFQDNSLFMRIDSTNELLWEKTFNNFEKGGAVSIVAEENNIFSVLNAPIGFSFNASAYLNKIDLEGRIVDSRQVLKDIRRARKMTLQRCEDGSKILATTNINDNGISGDDIFLVKLNQQDSIIWSTFAGGDNAIENFVSMIQTADGGFLAVGTTSSCSILTQSLYLTKISKDGEVLWDRVFGGTFLGEKSIIENSRGEFIVITSSQETNSLANSTTQFIKVDQEGRPI